MALQQQQHDGSPQTNNTNQVDIIQLPSVPQGDPHVVNHHDNVHLPHLRSLNLLESSRHSHNTFANAGQFVQGAQTNGNPQQWQSTIPLNPAVFPQVPSGPLRANYEETNVGSPMDTDTPIGAGDQSRHNRGSSVVSMDDPDVRDAVEVLAGMRSPSNRSVTMPSTQNTLNGEPEPLLSLLTESHPWIGGTINGSMSAYSSTKHYSPRVIKYVAESVERNIGSPVANTIGAVGRRTGMEGGLRRYLGANRRPSDLEGPDALSAHGNKRRRIDTNDAIDVEKGLRTPKMQSRSRSRADSEMSYPESLPAYDLDARSPKYEETQTATVLAQSPRQRQGSNQQSWGAQIMITTSGLGAALNDRALQNLKYCLNLLRKATQTISDVMQALKIVIEDYEQATSQRETTPNGTEIGSSEKMVTFEREERCRQIASRMQELGKTIWDTLHGVVERVSTYAGGALPANAQQIVRRQLVSMPYRWRHVVSTTQNEGANGETQNANRLLAFGKEGLDMMSQVGMVVDGTIVSAERWLDRMGRRQKEGTTASNTTVIEKEAAETLIDIGESESPKN